MHRILTRLFCILVSVFFSACTQSKKSSVDGFAEARLEFALPKTFSSSAGLRSPPATVAGFDCLIVNVMAADIKPVVPGNYDTPFADILAGSHCAYPGIISQPIALAAGSNQIRLRIPVGVQRVIQLAGVVSSNGCSAPLIKVTADPNDSDLHPNYSGVYEIGRAVVNLSGDAVVTINNQYNASNPKEIQCEGAPDIDCSQFLTASPFATGDGTEANPYRICTADQFENIRTRVGLFWFALESDILLSFSDWTPIGEIGTPFLGSLDGKLHTVSGFGTTTSRSTGVGLFGEIAGTVQRLTLEGYTLANPSDSHVGALAGKNTGTISRVTVGTGAVTGDSSVGGLVGFNTGTILQSSSAAAVTGGGTDVGGFIGGMSAGSVSRCAATGAVLNGTAWVGGFAGRATGSGTLISRSSATGTVLGQNTVGGFIGSLETNARIEDCYSTGSVTVASNVAGGFVGSISNAQIVRAYARPSAIIAGTDYGPFGGANVSGSGTFSGIYNPTSFAIDGSGFTGFALTVPQFSVASNFVGFDFVSIWDNTGNTVPPFLR
jgi:hypothetical protein